jgi:putative tryptophan/tyrosine transport system substrate-binding protein
MLRETLREAGWKFGSTIVIEFEWYGGDANAAYDIARTFIGRRMDLVLANGAPALDALVKLGAKMPIVFVLVSNPLGAGYVSSLARPGGNVTGFSTFEPEIAGKWFQLLRQVAPDISHVNMLLEPKFSSFNALWEVIASIALREGLQHKAAFASNLQEVEAAIKTIAEQDRPGLIVAPNPVSTTNRARIVTLANASRIPTVCPYRFYLKEGALITYGFKAIDQYRRAALYVDRILKGEHAGDLPVQMPLVFELGVNLKTAQAIGLSVPQSLIVTADEVFE